MEHHKDTTGWSIIGLVLALVTSQDLIVQALIAMLFPTIGWTILYFIKREITHRFPPKESKDKNKEMIQ